jgi:hypothetical protein
MWGPLEPAVCRRLQVSLSARLQVAPDHPNLRSRIVVTTRKQVAEQRSGTRPAQNTSAFDARNRKAVRPGRRPGGSKYLV